MVFLMFQHVAICPWFAETGILDGTDKNKLKEKVKFSFVPVERVGEAFETVVKDQRQEIQGEGVENDIVKSY